jgi:predicted phage-related endonuclease|tara:strand:+ start:302 stop:1141 length:840 start_codon:yes stop_codon:yes gene_type:complete
VNVLKVTQGSAEWLDVRKGKLTGSLAPAMMGHGYKSRSEAMEQFLELSPDEVFNDFTKDLFEKGHQTEKIARVKVENQLDQPLSPVTATRDYNGLPLLASFDGVSFDHSLVWEHKYTTKTPADFSREIPARYYWQLEHNMLVSESNESLLTVTYKDKITNYRYASVPERRLDLIKGWEQWLDDCSAYERTDIETVNIARKYIIKKNEADILLQEIKLLADQLYQQAGKQDMAVGGLKVKVYQASSKQSASSYCKEQGIELPAIKGEQLLRHRITINREH